MADDEKLLNDSEIDDYSESTNTTNQTAEKAEKTGQNMFILKK